MLLVVVTVSPVVFMTLVVMIAMVVTAVMVLVNDRVPLAPGDQVAVDWESSHKRYSKRHRQAPPEQEVQGASIHSTRYDEHYQVVHYFHDGYRERVRSERQRDRRGESNLRPQEGHHRQRVAEEEGQDDGQGDGGEVVPPQGVGDDQPQHLAEGAAC